MEPVPMYLAWYLLKIRRHANETGYIERRLSAMDATKAVYETTMLKELHELHLIGISDQTARLRLAEYGRNPLNRLLDRPVRFDVVVAPSSFSMFARGHYLPIEFAASALKWLLASFLGAAIALLVSGGA